MNRLLILIFLLASTYNTSAQKKQKVTLVLPIGHLQMINSLCITPDGKQLITGSGDNNIIFWDIKSERQVRILHDNLPIRKIIVSPDGKKLYTTSGMGTSNILSPLYFKEWDLSDGSSRILPFSGNDEMEISHDGRFLLVPHFERRSGEGGLSYKTGIWDLVKNDSLTTFSNTYSRDIAAFAFYYDKNGHSIISSNKITKHYYGGGDSSYKTISFLPLADPSATRKGKEEIVIKEHLTKITTEPKTGDIACRVKREVRVLRQRDLSPLLIYDFKKRSIENIRFSQDGSYLFVHSKENRNHFIDVWKTGAYKHVFHSILPGLTRFSDIAIAPKGDFFAVASTKNAYIYSIDGRPLRTHESHCQQIYSYSFSEQNNLIRTAHNWAAPGEALDSNALKFRELAALSLLEGSGIDTRMPNAELDSLKERKIKNLEAFRLKNAPNASMRIWDFYSGEVHTSYPDNSTYLNKEFSTDKRFLLIPDVAMQMQGDAITAFHEVAQLSPNSNSGVVNRLQDKNSDIVKYAKDTNSRINKAFGFITKLINTQTRDTFRLIAIDSTDWIVLTNDNYYMCSKDGARYLNFYTNNKMYSVDQFDPIYNRPDIVLGRIGLASDDVIKSYRLLYYRRVLNQDIDTTSFNYDLNVPEIEILDQEEIFITSKEKNYEFNIKARDAMTELRTLFINVNGTPIYNSQGYDLYARRSKTVNEKIKIHLSNGRNIIDMYVVNAKGIKSRTERFEINYTGPKVKPDLFVYGIGAAKYKISGLNLKYPSKDANDVATFFGNANSEYGQIKCRIISNEDVTCKNIMAIKEQLSNTKVDDKVIIYYSGHGMLSADRNLYLGTFDVDPSQPQEKGLPYNDLEMLLADIPSRNRILFIDACHSGEVDKNEQQVTETGKVVFTSLDQLGKSKGSAPYYTSQTDLSYFETMKKQFIDVRKNAGITVIAASGGSQYAIEDDKWQNSVFAYCLINGLRSHDADVNKDLKITLSEIQKYIYSEVGRITKFQQKPTFRIENPVIDYQLL